MKLTSTNFQGLLNRRFLDNFLPIPATHPFQVGALAPPFELLDVTSDRSLKLADYVIYGDRPDQSSPPYRAVLLAFTRIFTEHQYCPLCFPHIQALNQSYSSFQQRQTAVWMITSTDPQQSKIVARDLGLSMPLLSDPSCRVFRAYRVGQALGAPLPAQFLIDAQGRIHFRHLFSFLEPNASIDRLLAELDHLSGSSA